MAAVMKRLKDIQAEQNPQKRHASDEPEAQKIRNERKKMKRASGEGKIEGRLKFFIATNEDKLTLLNKFDQVKIALGDGRISTVTNLDALTAVMDFYLAHNGSPSVSTGDDLESVSDKEQFTSYQYCRRQDSTEEMYLVTQSAINHMIKQVQQHDRDCTEPLTISQSDRFQHVLKCTLKCGGTCGPLKWVSSPRIEGGQFLSNIRMAHTI